MESAAIFSTGLAVVVALLGALLRDMIQRRDRDVDQVRALAIENKDRIHAVEVRLAMLEARAERIADLVTQREFESFATEIREDVREIKQALIPRYRSGTSTPAGGTTAVRGEPR